MDLFWDFLSLHFMPNIFLRYLTSLSILIKYPVPVSYTHLDVYKRQVRFYECTVGEKVNTKIQYVHSLTEGKLNAVVNTVHIAIIEVHQAIITNVINKGHSKVNKKTLIVLVQFTQLN